MADSATLRGVLDDMRAEGEELEPVVAGLPDGKWSVPTPAAGWTVAHQIAHLAWTDERSLLAVTDPEGFRRETEGLMARENPMAFVDEAAGEGARARPAEILDRWRASRAALLDALSGQPSGARFPWYGLPMSVAGMATARIMEMWAHGRDVTDALGVPHAVSDRLRHVVRIGVRARDYAYAMHGLEPPAEPFRVEVTGPSGQLWAHGPEAAAQRVTGDAVDFCLLVTQRLHRDDAHVRAEGEDAGRWLGIAQSFAGLPGGGRPPKRDGARA